MLLYSMPALARSTTWSTILRKYLGPSPLAFYSTGRLFRDGSALSLVGQSSSPWSSVYTSGLTSTRSECILISPYEHRLMPPRHYTRASPNLGTIDFTDPAYGGRVVLYVLFGVLDAMWQTTSYWLMGAMSNDPAKLAFLTGFCKGCCTLYSSFTDRLLSDKSLQSAGAAVIWRVDALKNP